ncbi:hypothetical protein GCM10018980_19600 [Streptomyces capoamus]|uniref:Uncharacterized protein n=1 Tax=Streptomyces capoamus TaxID=68183 RepID=A0A919C1Z1_9ACTN|nr:hypothetical protein GCM10010501_33190 [Streptomyces libani subsp. rufus]GHG43032.1 hypothetical protein GCM10018980_19600 [Streptomyces capoamus]
MTGHRLTSTVQRLDRGGSSRKESADIGARVSRSQRMPPPTVTPPSTSALTAASSGAGTPSPDVVPNELGRRHAGPGGVPKLAEGTGARQLFGVDRSTVNR